MHWKTFNVALTYIKVHSIDFNVLSTYTLMCSYVAIFMDLIVIINIFYLITTFIVEVKKRLRKQTINLNDPLTF